MSFIKKINIGNEKKNERTKKILVEINNNNNILAFGKRNNLYKKVLLSFILLFI